jgi:hypothetical protein
MAQEPDWLWVQLSNYGYSRWGAPLSLARALSALRRAAPDLGIAVCAHETHCRPQQLGRKGRLLSPWQRYTVGAVVRRADRVFTSIGRYERQIVEDYAVPAERVVRLPIGSNVPQACLSPAERERLRQALGWGAQELVAATFGSFASQLRALRQCGPQLARGLAARQLDRVVCLGGNGTAVPRELETWARLFAGGHFEVLGYQRERTVGEILECADFAFCAYPRPLLGKSTAFAAFALAGLPVLVADSTASDASGSDEPPILPVGSWDWNQARSEELSAHRRTLREYAAAHYKWSAIAKRALAAMQTATRRGTRTQVVGTR